MFLLSNYFSLFSNSLSPHPPPPLPSNGLAHLRPSVPPPPISLQSGNPHSFQNPVLVFPFQVPRRSTPLPAPHLRSTHRPIRPPPHINVNSPDPRPDLNKTSSSPHNLQIPKHTPLLSTQPSYNHPLTFSLSTIINMKYSIVFIGALAALATAQSELSQCGVSSPHSQFASILLRKFPIHNQNHPMSKH